MIDVCAYPNTPGNVFHLAALCGGSFDSICERTGAIPIVDYVTHKGKKIDRYRSICFRYSNGRFAMLVKEDSDVNMKIKLQEIGVDAFSISDLSELIAYCDIQDASVNRRLVPWVKWI